MGPAETFQSSTTEGWFSGGNNPHAPEVVLGGSPGGATDNDLRVASSGFVGPGGKLVVIARPQWNGNDVAAGVTGIAMDLLDKGTTESNLRLYLDGPSASVAVGATGVILAANSIWTHGVFPLLPALLHGSEAIALTVVAHLRLFHATSAA